GLDCTSGDAPPALSIALDTSSDFGNPDPYSHAMLSRISNPASSTAAASRCQVRDPPNASMWPPGLSTRRHSAAQRPHHSWNAAGVDQPSHVEPMNSRAYGGSVTTASTLASGSSRSTSRQSPW